MVSRVYLPGPQFAKLLRAPAAKADNVNICALLRDLFNAPILCVVQQVVVETMAVDVTNHLDLDQGFNGLVLHMRGFGSRNMLLSYQIVYVLPDARKLVVKLKLP